MPRERYTRTTNICGNSDKCTLGTDGKMEYCFYQYLFGDRTKQQKLNCLDKNDGARQRRSEAYRLE